jgi:hypothetical protein
MTRLACCRVPPETILTRLLIDGTSDWMMRLEVSRQIVAYWFASHDRLNADFRAVCVRPSIPYVVQVKAQTYAFPTHWRRPGEFR